MFLLIIPTCGNRPTFKRWLLTLEKRREARFHIYLLLDVVKLNQYKVIILPIFWNRDVEPTFRAVWADNQTFDEVLISKRMVQDHMPDNVLDALDKVRGHSNNTWHFLGTLPPLWHFTFLNNSLKEILGTGVWNE